MRPCLPLAAGPVGHANSPHPSSREGHHSTAQWSSSYFRTILGRLSKRGNKYMRTLFIIGARAVLAKPGSWVKFGLQGWLAAAAKRLHHNVLAAALANKLARIAWSVLYHGRSFARDFEPQSVS